MKGNSWNRTNEDYLLTEIAEIPRFPERVRVMGVVPRPFPLLHNPVSKASIVP